MKHSFITTATTTIIILLMSASAQAGDKTVTSIDDVLKSDSDTIREYTANKDDCDMILKRICRGGAPKAECVFMYPKPGGIITIDCRTGTRTKPSN